MQPFLTGFAKEHIPGLQIWRFKFLSLELTRSVTLSNSLNLSEP